MAQSRVANSMLMLDADLAALFGQLTVEDLVEGAALFNGLQADINEAHLRQNFGFLDNEK